MKRYIATILCLLAFTAAYAGDEAVYEKLHTSYTLAADGSQQYRRVMDLKLQTHTSFNNLFGETFVVYDPEYQTLTINEAYTTQADGTVVPLPDNAVNESLPHAAADAPAYNRLLEAVITHTGLEIGATIHLDYTLTTKAGLYPALEVCETLTEPAAAVKERRIEITVPAGTELRYDPAMKPSRTGDTYTWQFRNLAAYYDEDKMPQNGEGRPILCATTFTSTADALSRIASTERDIVRIPGLARDSKAETVKAYLNYITQNLGSCGVTPYMAGYRSRTATEVLSSAYGTDLEKCRLAARALAAEGIDAELVAVYPAFHAVKMLRDIKNFAVRVTIDGKDEYYTSTGSALSRARSDRDEVYSVTSGEKIGFAPCPNSYRAETRITVKGTEATVTADIETESNGTTSKTDKAPAVSVSDCSGYRLVKLPAIGLAESWAPNMGTERRQYFEIPYVCDDEVSFAVTTDGRILTPSRKLKISNSVGEVTLRIEVDGGNATVTRNVKINKTIIPPAEWKSARAILTALTDRAYSELIVK